MIKRYFLIIFFIVLTDQFLKYFLPFKIRNYGASFNILENNVKLLLFISLIALILFLYLFYKNLFTKKLHQKNEKELFGLSFLIGGTLSNLIDRVFLGYIIDYIPFFGLFNFNLADIANFIGVLILIKNIFEKPKLNK